MAKNCIGSLRFFRKNRPWATFLQLALAFEHSENRIAGEKLTEEELQNDIYRKIFLNHLNENKKIRIEEHESDKWSGQRVTFYLLHLPFEQCEKYAAKMSINKPIDPKHVQIVDELMKNDTGGLH